MSLAPDGQEVKAETLYAVVHVPTGRIIAAFEDFKNASTERTTQQIHGVQCWIEVRQMQVHSVKGIRP